MEKDKDKELSPLGTMTISHRGIAAVTVFYDLQDFDACRKWMARFSIPSRSKYECIRVNYSEVEVEYFVKKKGSQPPFLDKTLTLEEAKKEGEKDGGA